MLWALIPKQIWNRSFKWGTINPFLSMGCKVTISQSWSLEKISADRPGSNPCAFEPGRLADIFSELKLWPLVSLQPLAQNQCLVSHFKDHFISVWGIKPKAFEWLLTHVILAQVRPISMGFKYVVSGGFGWTHLYFTFFQISELPVPEFFVNGCQCFTEFHHVLKTLKKICRSSEN